MTSPLRKVEETFARIVELEPEKREEALRASCGADHALRVEVESLLRHADPPETFLAGSALGVDVGLSSGPDEVVGQLIGPYRVMQRLASGGMGTVYLASRVDGQFEQQVAIKVVKRGMDTDHILRHFADERRNLASLRHPNIAQLLDAGAMPNGQPYLVMEYVDGISIDRHCDERRLSVSERLRLFCLACEAVRFAHQKLLVHRDLKPGNILVDSRGNPKLLDFGVSKVLVGSERPEMTAAEERRFTPEYASPEQVSGQPLSTASDIYSLGIILFELLTGTRPYRFPTRSFAEINRIVSEEEVPPPSLAVKRGAPRVRASIKEEEVPLVRSETSHERLARRLSGDLDTIVLKATHKDPTRRYASVEQFIADIQRHRSGMPVLARPDTLAYRTRKFVRRHAFAVASAIGVALLLAVGLGVAVWQGLVAREQRDAAYLARDQAEATADFLQRMISAADPAVEGPEASIRTVLESAALTADTALKRQPLVEAAVRSTIGRTYLGLGLLEEAERNIRAAQSTRAAMLPPGHHDLAESEFDLAQLYYAQGKYSEAEELLGHSLATHRRLRGVENLDTARVLNDLGAVQRSLGKLAEAEAAHREALQIREKLMGRQSLEVAESFNNLAGVLRAKGDAQGASAMAAEVLQIRRKLLREEHPLVIQSMANLAVMAAGEGDFAQAEELLRQVIELDRKLFGDGHPALAVDLASLGRMLIVQRRYTEAESLLREALEIRRKRLPKDDLRLLLSQADLGRCLVRLDRAGEAEPLLADALHRAVPRLNQASASWLAAAEDLERLYESSGRQAEAESVRAMKPMLETGAAKP